MSAARLCRWLCWLGLLGLHVSALAHPLRLSLAEIEYASGQGLLTISLRLFLTDVNEALVFDPNSTELAFCQSDESPDAERLLLEYLDRFFYVKANGRKVALSIVEKKLSGEGDNTALGVLFEHRPAEPLTSLEIRNAVFTDLFFDQSNIVYVHVDGKSKSLMLNKKTPEHALTF
ncbi:MAG: DUF6702 family protein [Pseudomonadota bacterium]